MSRNFTAGARESSARWIRFQWPHFSQVSYRYFTVGEMRLRSPFLVFVAGTADKATGAGIQGAARVCRASTPVALSYGSCHVEIGHSTQVVVIARQGIKIFACRRRGGRDGNTLRITTEEVRQQHECCKAFRPSECFWKRAELWCLLSKIRFRASLVFQSTTTGTQELIEGILVLPYDRETIRFLDCTDDQSDWVRSNKLDVSNDRTKVLGMAIRLGLEANSLLCCKNLVAVNNVECIVRSLLQAERIAVFLLVSLAVTSRQRFGAVYELGAKRKVLGRGRSVMAHSQGQPLSHTERSG